MPDDDLQLTGRLFWCMAAADKNRAEDYGIPWAVLCEELTKLATRLLAIQARGTAKMVWDAEMTAGTE